MNSTEDTALHADQYFDLVASYTDAALDAAHAATRASMGNDATGARRALRRAHRAVRGAVWAAGLALAAAPGSVAAIDAEAEAADARQAYEQAVLDVGRDLLAAREAHNAD